MLRAGMITFVAAAALLAACDNGSVSDQAQGRSVDATGQAEVAATEVAAVQPDMASASPSAEATPPGDVPDAVLPQLAYAYGVTIEAPADEIAGLAARHEQACIQAGPQVCQVIGSSTQSFGQDERQATLELRAGPGWLRTFRNGLARDAETVDGRIADSSTTSEDLTRALIDTEAHLRAKTTLRDRLQTMLATRDGNLQTVLEVERELARVQAEIDSANSTLEMMRARVSMSRLTLTYQSRGVMAPDSATAPLASALNNALGIFMTGLAAIVTILAFGLPFLIIVGPVAWLSLRAAKRRRERRAAERRRANEAALSDQP